MEMPVPVSWETIVRQHAGMVFGAAWRILGNAADAEDIAQEVFLEAYLKWRESADIQWPNLLRRLAVYRALDRARGRKPAALPDELAKAATREAGPVEAAVANELSGLLRQALDKLPTREAEVFCLRYFEGLGHTEIAAALGIKSGAVAVALSKARAKLSNLLSRALTGELR
jgi:RNA polymerase sigma-70 factor, ECF subfamily